MGSNNVAVIDGNGARLATFDVGQGPTGLCLDEGRGRLYVFNRFDASISVVDTLSLAGVQLVNLYDPTPDVIRRGRPFLYDARLTSGLGVTACASCHVDGRMDQLAWDLGVPGNPVKPFDQFCDDFAQGLLPDPPRCQDFHPLKGPMITQTLQGIIGTEPLHWRGDRQRLADFNGTFVELMGHDRQLSDAEMAAFEAFVATITFPPNPNRNRDNSLKEELHGGNPQQGLDFFLHVPVDTTVGRLHRVAPLIRPTFERNSPILSCNRCHQLHLGTNKAVQSAIDLNEPQGFKVPQIRNVWDRVGFDRSSQENGRGFGFAHDGASATLEEFFGLAVFDFGQGEAAAQHVRDVIAFLESLSVDTHAGVGMQVTLDAREAGDAQAAADADLMLRLADGGEVGLVVHGMLDGAIRSLTYQRGGVFQEGASGAVWTTVQLRSGGEAMTWMVVPLGSEDRLGRGGG